MKLVVKKLEGCCYIDDVDDIVSVARVIGDGGSNAGGGAKAEAIANLFAASPKLLAILKRIAEPSMTYIGSYVADGQISAADIKEAREIIAAVEQKS